MATPPGFADVAVELTLASFNRSSYLTFGVDPVDTDPLLVATSISAAIQAAGSLKSVIDSDVTITSIHVALGTDGGEDLSADFATTIVGGAALTGPPPNCAVLVHKRSARGGRRGRGRLFLPWAIAEGNIDEKGALTAPSITAMNAAMAAFLTALQTNNVRMVLLHRPGKTTAGPPDNVTSLQTDPIIGTQRRRLGRT